MMGCWSRSCSRVRASVENPVLVFRSGVSPNFSYSTVRSWGTELTLNGSPARSWMVASSEWTSSVSAAAMDRSTSRSTGIPTTSMRASTRTRGCSMSTLSPSSPASARAASMGDRSRASTEARRTDSSAGRIEPRRVPGVSGADPGVVAGRNVQDEGALALGPRAVVDLHGEEAGGQVTNPVAVGGRVEQVGARPPCPGRAG